MPMSIDAMAVSQGIYVWDRDLFGSEAIFCDFFLLWRITEDEEGVTKRQECPPSSSRRKVIMGPGIVIVERGWDQSRQGHGTRDCL